MRPARVLAIAATVATVAWSCNASGAGKGTLRPGKLRVGALERTFVTYAPASLKAGAPILILFHGSGGDGASFRDYTGQRFDALADEKGFVVVYPDGFQGNWDDCRKAASYPARAQHIDDVG